MLSYKDNTIQEPTQDNYFAPDYVYDARDGWRVAFGLTAYDSSSDPAPFDDTYGTVGAYIKIWGEKDAAGNSTPTYFKKLETEPCKDSDINIDNVENQDKFKFFAPAPEFADDVKRFRNVLNCIKNDDHELMGDYNSAAAKQLVVTFEMCRRGKTAGVNCKSESVIKDWMARKFLLTLENQIEFNKDLVEKDKLKKSSRLIYNVLSPQIRSDVYNYLQITELDLSDEVASVSGAGETYTMFKVEPGPFRMYDFKDDVQLAINYELSRDLRIIRRKVYGLLDFLGDLGGLAGALRGIFTGAIIVFQYKATISYVSNHTYLIKDGDENQSNVNQR